MNRQWALLRLALQFLTRLPVPSEPRLRPARLRACAGYFPLVGALVGGVAAGVLVLASLAWPPWVAATLGAAAAVWLTGALHEDGLADTADALGGGAGRERALAIMKDSRIGSFGGVALVLALLLRVACMAALAQPAGGGAAVRAVAVVVASHVLSRAAPVWIMARLPYAGDTQSAKVRPLARRLRPATLAAALAWAVALTLGCGAAAAALGAWPWRVALAAAVSSLGCAGVVARLAERWLRRRLGGFTGDTLGAVQQVCELCGLLAWLAWLPAGAAA